MDKVTHSFSVLSPGSRVPVNELTSSRFVQAPAQKASTAAPLLCELKLRPEVRYFQVLPKKVDAESPVVVVVHGISRGARELAQTFSILANENGAVVIAPLFDEVHFKGYQRPGMQKTAITSRSDLALEAILHEVQENLGVDTKRFRLFGFSGGAQFSHRYALLCPERVMQLVVAAAGWYTVLDNDQSYPYGLGNKTLSPECKLRLNEMLSIPILILSGGDDVHRDPGLNKSKRIDRSQGVNRLERAVSWERSLRDYATASGKDAVLHHTVIADAGHNFMENVDFFELHHMVQEFLFARS